MFLLLTVVVLGTVFAGGRLVTAQESETASHPAVGSWLVETDPADADYYPRMITLSADGSALFISGHQTTAVGAWTPASDTTADLTFTQVTDGPAYIKIRAGIEIAPDGQSLTGTFTFEAVFDPAGGGTSGEIGPGTITGTRMVAEAPGTPTSSFEEFFAVPGATPEATPEATPAP
jgi:hypothetical protein